MGLIEGPDLVQQLRRGRFLVEREERRNGFVLAAHGRKALVTIEGNHFVTALQLFDLVEQGEAFFIPTGAEVDVGELVVEIRPLREILQQILVAGDAFRRILPIINAGEVVVIAEPVVPGLAFDGLGKVLRTGVVIPAVEPGHAEVIPESAFRGMGFGKRREQGDDLVEL